MTRSLAFLLLALSVLCSAQTPQIKSGATVYIEPMEGYETYLAAAFTKKQVPLILVTDKGKADYFITSTVSQRAPSQPAVVINNTNNVNGSGHQESGGYPGSGYPGSGYPSSGYGATLGTISASISVIDPHSSQVLFAYSVGKTGNANRIQSTAEACAKHLKEFIQTKRKK